MRSSLVFLALLGLVALAAVSAEPMDEGAEDVMGTEDVDAQDQEEQPVEEEDESSDNAEEGEDEDAAASSDEQEEEEQPEEDVQDEESQDEAESDASSTDVDISRNKERLQQVLVTMYGVPEYDLQELADEVMSIKSHLRDAYTTLKEKRNHLARELDAIRQKITALKQQVTSVTDRVRRLKRKAEEDARLRAERLRKQLRARIRAHRAGLDFVKKLSEQVAGLRESISAKFGKKVAEIQTTLLEYAPDMENWTGQDVAKDVAENKQFGVRSRQGRLYTKRHLKNIVARMEAKLRSQYLSAKAALRRAHTAIVSPHVGRLEQLLNGLKSQLSTLEAKGADVATALNEVEHGHPSLSQLRTEFANVKAIIDQIYTQQRLVVPKVAPRQHPCVAAVKKVHRHFNRCRSNLAKAVARKAPRTETYVLWKQYVVAKNSLKSHVHGCRKASEEEQDVEEEQNDNQDNQDE